MSTVTLDDLRYARLITTGPKHRGLSEGDAAALAFDRLLVFDDSQVGVPCDEQVQLPIVGLKPPQTNRVRGLRDQLPHLTSKFRRIRLGGFEYLRSVVHTNSHDSSPSVAGSDADTSDATKSTVGDAADVRNPSGASAAPSGDAS